MEVKILSAKFNIKNSNKIKTAKQHGAYQTLDKVFAMEPVEVIEQVKASGLRGRGGAGFPAGVKWGFLPKDTGKPVYLAVNSDESEPATFKDRYILVEDPHMMIEGIIICSYAIGSHDTYIYIRGEYTTQAKILQAAIDEAYKEGYLGEKVAGRDFRIDVTIHRGAGAYVCGEETALLESIEGLDLEPIDEVEQCCGFGGTFSVSFPNISKTMGELKIENLTACKPDIIAAADMGCMMHFGGMMDKQGNTTKRQHIAQVLRDSLKNAGKL